MTSFFLERAVARLAGSKRLASDLCFKGGFVALRSYDSNRFTKDLAAAEIKEAMTTDLRDGVWFKFFKKIPIAGQSGYTGKSLKFRTGQGAAFKNERKAQIIDIDLGVGDIVRPQPRVATLKPLIDSQLVSWKIYPIEAMIAEKLQSLVALGDASGRSKDIYDLSIFLPKAEPDALREALKSTFECQNTPLPLSVSDFLTRLDTTLLKRGWQSSKATIIGRPEFEDCFEKIAAVLRKLNI